MKPLIIANFKMNFHLREVENYAKKLMSGNYNNQLIIAAPSIFSAYLCNKFPKLEFCTQDVSIFNNHGSYTGECSAEMINNCGINYAIIGHSERRTHFRETNKIIRKKVENCLDSGIKPIICIGETLEVRQNNHFKDFLVQQILESVPENADDIIIAYEPIWAIGTGITPSTDEISEIFDLIKTHKDLTTVAKNADLVYGGSVNSGNCGEILTASHINGLLVGSASLDQNEITAILNS